LAFAFALESTLKIGVEIFEAQRQEDSCNEGYCNSGSAIDFGAIAHRHRIIVIGSS
jgi:hypothetical protein